MYHHIIMKEFVLRLFTFIAALFIASSLVSGFTISNLATYVILAIFLSILQFLLKPTIIFITFPYNNFTAFVTNFLILSLIFYFFNLVMPGVIISDGSIGPYISPAIVVPAIEMKSYVVIFFSSFIISLINSIITWAISKSKN